VNARLALRLTLALWRDQPLRLAVTTLAIATGVALCSAIWFVNAGALAAFERAARQLVGEADLVLRGPRAGFAERSYAAVAAAPGVRVASPVLEVDVEVAAPRQQTLLRILGVDPFRAGALQPALFGELAPAPGRDFLDLFDARSIFLSPAAAAALGVGIGGRFEVLVGTQPRELLVAGLLSADAYPLPLGIMDIASAQWTLERLGVLTRIDVRLEPGAGADAVRARLEALLPPGTAAFTPQFEAARAASATRSYRVNLNMLALVSLLTGAFLVFATQSLSVLRRRTSLALLRALGVTRAGLRRALLAEGVGLGAIGAVLGVIAGHLLAAWLLARLRGDLGGGQLAAAGEPLQLQPLAALAFVAIGIAVAAAGAWLPAREAARAAPARALRAGDAEETLAPLTTVWPALVLLAAGAGLSLLPPLGGLPIAGYAAVAALLLGAVMLVPRVAGALLARMPPTGRTAFDLGVAQLRGRAGQATVALATIIVSFSLMVAMAIMVHSFRVSFERWLGELLPADVQLRAPQGADSVRFDERTQRAIALADGVARVQFRRVQQVLLGPDGGAVALIARDAPQELPLLRRAPSGAAAGRPVAYASEAVVDRYGARLGGELLLPLAGREIAFSVGGIFRDYGRSTGAIVIARDDYVARTGDRAATEASLWLAPGAAADGAIAAVRRAVEAAGGRAAALEMLATPEVRERSLRAFDRAFLLTYALEGIAVVIGLLGVAFAASSTVIARRAEFGMLRHVGLRRRDVRAMLAGEGLVSSAIGVLYGLLTGGALSLVLVYVINRQSFSWSIDLAIPWGLLAALSLVLVAAAAATSIASGRAATGEAAVRAVREDW
jgi:putative ABC transport system permease protein